MSDEVVQLLTEKPLVYFAAILSLGIAAQWLAWRLRVPSILLLLAAGFALGQLAPGVTEEVIGDLLLPVVSLSVAVILFEGGMTLRIGELKEVGSAALRLVTVGVLIAWVLTTLAAWKILGWDLRIAALMGAILVVTGPTVIAPLLRHVRPTRRIGSIVKWEGIVIDPVGAILAVLVFEGIVASGEGESAWTTIAIMLGSTVLLSSAIALLVAALLIVVLRNYWIPDHLHNPLFLAAALASFALSNVMMSESGLATVTLLGVILANQKKVPIKHVMQFKENLQVLLISVLFVVMASRVAMGDLTQLGWRGVLFLATLIFLVRPAAVFLATIRSDLPMKERVFLAALAPRGIVAAAVAALFALEVAHLFGDTLPEGADEMAPLALLVIVGTVAVYGLAAAPIARRLGLAVASAQGVLFAGCDPWVRPIAEALQNEGFSVLLVDTNRRSVSMARMAGLPAECASILSEYVTEELDLTGIGRLVAMTPSDEVNTLATMEFHHIFGRAEVYQLAPWDFGAGRRESVASSLRGRPLFGEAITHASLAQRLLGGQQVKCTKLTDTYDYEAFRSMYGESALVLFVIDESRQLQIVTGEAEPTPKPEQTIVALVDIPQPSGEEKE